MDYLGLLESYGVPLVVAVAFWIYIQKQNKYITEELSKEIRESFGRLEQIIIKLIDNGKRNELELKKMETSYRVLAETIARLSGNGLSDKMLRKLEKYDRWTPGYL